MSHTHNLDCGHSTEGRGECHMSVVIPCPGHFSLLYAEAMQQALPGAERGAFRRTMLHLNGDGMAVGAWWTWMALISRYMLAPGVDRLRALKLGTPPVPPDAPAAYREAVPLVSFAVRSAVLDDFAALDETLTTVTTKLSPEAALTFLRSCAGTAAVCVERNDDITSADLGAWGLLGSQVSSAAGGQVLPLVTGMVLGHQRPNSREVVGELFDRLLRLPSRKAMAAALDMVGRAMAQTVTSEPLVLVADGVPGRPGSAVEGLVDLDAASPENTERALMAGVWAMRASKVYAQVADEAEAARRLRGLVEQHGSPGRFATDVMLAGTQILGYAHAMDVDEVGGNTPVQDPADHPDG